MIEQLFPMECPLCPLGWQKNPWMLAVSFSLGLGSMGAILEDRILGLPELINSSKLFSPQRTTSSSAWPSSLPISTPPLHTHNDWTGLLNSKLRNPFLMLLSCFLLSSTPPLSLPCLFSSHYIWHKKYWLATLCLRCCAKLREQNVERTQGWVLGAEGWRWPALWEPHLRGER